MFQTVCNYAKPKRFNPRDGFFDRPPISQYPGNADDFGEPAPIVFLFIFDRVLDGLCSHNFSQKQNGRDRARTRDFFRVKEALYQLSYSPATVIIKSCPPFVKPLLRRYNGADAKWNG